MLISYRIAKLERLLSKILPITTIKCENCKSYEKGIFEDKTFGRTQEKYQCARFKKFPRNWQYCNYFDKKRVINKKTKTYCTKCNNLGKFVELKQTPSCNERKVKYKCTLGNSRLIPEKMHDRSYDKVDINYGDLKLIGCKGFKTSLFQRFRNRYMIWRN